MKIGFVGTGNMGNPMAGNLLKAGHNLTVHDLNRESAAGLIENGAGWAGTPKEAARNSEIVFTSLPGPREMEAVALGEDGILEGANTGSVYVDLSTNSPTVIRRVHRLFLEKGVTVMDAPVSGGPYGATESSLAVMVGVRRQCSTV